MKNPPIKSTPQRPRFPAGGFHLPAVSIGIVVAFVAGIVFWGGFNTALEASNTEQFCISCHEMRDNVYAEYKETIHYTNPAGVRASCPDCHVPRPWIYKIARKIRASNELLHKVMGTIDTREKFEAHRLELANHVWDTMKSTDSRECRNCHSQVYMDLEKQDKSARKKHAADYMKENNKTCIDCHKGIAHHLPKAPDNG
jgi:cytochrome c-type protein NapC